MVVRVGQSISLESHVVLQRRRVVASGYDHTLMVGACSEA
jgi:hypothetical protein